MQRKQTLTLGLVISLSLLVGCSSGPASKPSDYPEPLYSSARIVPEGVESVQDVYDPWEPMNRAIYNFNYHFDQKIFLPVVRGWQWILPDFAEKGIHNFFNNWRDLRTFWNSVLQLSPEKSAQSLGRVLINTTVGLLGFIDVATSMDIPRPQEDFGQTLGRWGVGQGPFLVVPLLGPSNLRDGIGLIPDFYIQSQIQDEVYADDLQYVIPVLDAIDTRANTPFRYWENGSTFEYETVRWLWSTKRELDVAR